MLLANELRPRGTLLARQRPWNLDIFYISLIFSLQGFAENANYLSGRNGEWKLDLL
jgi:hypothetical protein